MRKLKLFMAIAVGLYSTNIAAQYIIDPTLPVPVPQAASSVSEYGFNANWQTVSDVEGYLVKAYVTLTAETEEETFDLLNTDFSFIESENTVDDPDDNGTTQGGFVFNELKIPNRCGWKTMNGVFAKGVLGINNAWYKIMANGSIVSPVLDLRNGDGKVHIKFKIKGDARAKKLTVQLRNIDVIPNEVLDADTIDVTTQWTEHEFTLEGGMRHSDILFMGLDAGNQQALYYFFDDLRVWQQPKVGQEVAVNYSDNNFVKDPTATTCYISTTDLAPKERYAFTVSSYADGKISNESRRVHLDETPTSVNRSITNSGIFIQQGVLHVNKSSEPVMVYNASGILIAKDMDNIPLPTKGFYIIKVGSIIYKMFNSY